MGIVCCQSQFLPIHGGRFFCNSPERSCSTSPVSAISSWGVRSKQATGTIIHRTNSQAFQALAKASSSSGKDTTRDRVIIMVDPLEAKRLAAKQMQELRAKEKFERRRQIEAINGAWAIIGLTAGLVIEGQTGKSIPMQLADYWGIITSFLHR